MTKQDHIDRLEKEVKDIFKKRYITKNEIRRGNSLIKKWILLTDWETDDSPILMGPEFPEFPPVSVPPSILEENPIWQK